ncbi:tudor domain-containing protein 6 [Xyrichtys novacula]|uniref:Tudor domain-containing protein 6 n=1 Tax=Xyrichtys novacula TaxID=13765 RepID=A0AAV1GWS8_XYRNO|nr:tudor domain-containing protein 6 [Xyrichtys novacula]
MTSVVGLPTKGSDVTVLITKVHLHPLCVLVEFWAKFNQEKTADYESLAKDIQSPGGIFQEFEGNAGDQCLVQFDGIWYRSRIVSRHGSKYCVFLIDKGTTLNTSSSKLAWGKKQHFSLPPEVELCVLANVLPVSSENRWSSVAFEFLRSLPGKSVKAHVQDVLLPHRTLLLHIPCISKQMYEMGIAKKLSPGAFLDFVLKSLQSHSEAEMPPGNGLTSKGESERLHNNEHFMYPELQAGTVETVTVTDVTNPQRIFCQLKVFSQEFRKLSEQITQSCEGRMSKCLVGPEMVGFPCAARGSDGRWYRSVLQQVLQANQVVEVLNVDYGKKQFVHLENVRPLATEFFRMPVVTYNCSLHGIIDKGVGWSANQIDYLKSLLLNKSVIAKFEYQSVSEGVYYVTFYGHENANLNKLFAASINSPLEMEKALGDYATGDTVYRPQYPPQPDRFKIKMSRKQEGQQIVERLSAEDLYLDSSHEAVVQHVSDPSEFWIQTLNFANELEVLMDRIYHLYKDSVGTDVKNPAVGLYCAAKAEDGDYYRAVVTEVGETKIKMFFLDYGNTEYVDRSNIRVLPDMFKELPRLALKCSLASIRPNGQKWSPSSSEFFIKATAGKVLKVHVTAKYEGCYVVQLADPEAQGERDLASLMCSSGHAEKVETQKQPKEKFYTQTACLPTAQLLGARLLGPHINHGPSSQLHSAGDLDANQRRTPTFKEYMFSTGSVLDVAVSFMESPNDFWCQLVQDSGLLKLLMHDIQAYYKDSEFQLPIETACVARHPDNRMWYRALVIRKQESQVTVLFVDYGQTETVSLYDLRTICPQFLPLHGQAFRCSLLNPVDPTSATTEWNKEATAKFYNFVETAASNFVILRCTIYAVMYNEQKIVFNIVDLETPFESVATSMASLHKSAVPKKTAGPSYRLDTYYYSTHDVKTGAEEQVTVTCVNNVSQFYCQLERNADVISDLMVKVNDLCHQLGKVKLPAVCGNLCFAKYTDGLWYRGQIKSIKPAILVHFVDYGDTIEVEKSDLLPVPREASDITSVPVQALVCSLSDVPADVPSEMNTWFETSVTECKFQALVVAREPDGKLQVELYHGKTQVNSKIKKMFKIEKQPESMVVHQSLRAPGLTPRSLKAAPKQAEEMETQTIRNNNSTSKAARDLKDVDKNLHSKPKTSQYLDENGQKGKAAPLKLYQPPHQREARGMTQSNTGNNSASAAAQAEQKQSCSPCPKQPVKSTALATKSQKERAVERLPKLADLPSKSITSGMEAEVYVSQCNNLLSFYVQLVKEEDDIYSLVEKLNNPKSVPQTDNIGDLHPGDLVQAEFAEDSSWYRAVVREIQSDATVLVEFVDFGNKAAIPVSKIGRLQKSFLELPAYGTHCMLSNAATLGEEEILGTELGSAFKEGIGENGEKVLKCRFIRQSGSVWEVSLKDGDEDLLCRITSRLSTDDSELTSGRLKQAEEKPAQDSDIMQEADNTHKVLKSRSLCYPRQEFSVGQKLEVYISSTNDDQTFWCQPADSEELDKITQSVAEVGDSANREGFDPASLSTGTPCIALFSDDNLWYRAEVISKDGNQPLVSFVDYGNGSRVSVSDVREISQDLTESPPQAFLCELEGLDASNGSWDSGAVDKLSALSEDKAFQLTVTRVTRDEGKIKHSVQIECEGQVMNEVLKTWWRPSMAENEPAEVEVTDSFKRSALCQPTVEEIAPSGNQPEYQNQEVEAPQADCDEHSAEDYVQSESLQFSTEENNSMASEPHTLRTTESLRKTPSQEELTMVSPTVVSEDELVDILTCDGGEDETLFPPEAEKDTEEEVASITGAFGIDDICPPLYENLTEPTNEPGIRPANLESLPGEVDTYSVEGSSEGAVLPPETIKCTEERFASMMRCFGPDDMDLLEATDESGTTKTVLPEEVHTHSIESISDTLMLFAPVEEKGDREVSDSLTSTTTVKMVPREAVWPSESSDLCEDTDVTHEDSMQVQSESLISFEEIPCEQLAEAPTEPETQVGDISCQDEALCIENKSVTEDETVALQDDNPSASPSDSEPRVRADPFPDLSSGRGDLSCWGDLFDRRL